MNRSTVFWAFALAATFSASRVDAAPLTVKLEASSRRIRAFDPLYVKVTITNETNETWLAKRPITGASGLIAFQRRYPGRGWRPFLSNSARHSIGTTQPIAVKAGEERVSREVFFAYNSFDEYFAFPHGGGTLQLRAVVHYGEEPVYSKPVTIAVAPVPWGEARLIKDSYKMLRYVAGIIDVGVADPVAVEKIQAALEPSKLKEAIELARLMTRLRKAAGEEERKRLIREFREIQKKSDPVTGEALSIVLARFFFRQKEWESLRAELARLPRGGFHRDSLAHQLKHATGRGLDASD